MNHTYNERWWSLDQALAWIETRERDAVAAAVELPQPDIVAPGPQGMAHFDALLGALKNPSREDEALLARIFDERRSDCDLLMAKLSPDVRLAIEGFDSYFGSRWLRRGADVRTLLRLLREGRLKARGHLPGEPLARDLLPNDWATLDIGGESSLRVWRAGRVGVTGEGDIETVRVCRDGLLKEFLAEAPSDEEIMDVLREGMEKRGGDLTQRDGVTFVRNRFPNAPKARIMSLVKSMTGHTKRGPRGPRRQLSGALLGSGSKEIN